eukprot:1158688-Pelagomonas_calceolata.AAC.7
MDMQPRGIDGGPMAAKRHAAERHAPPCNQKNAPHAINGHAAKVHQRTDGIQKTYAAKRRAPPCTAKVPPMSSS